MSTIQHFFAALVLLGALQGFITGVLLLSSRHKKYADRFLAWLILFISLACLNIYLLETLPSSLPPFWHIARVTIPMIIIMPLGPLIYFHTKASLQPNFRMRKIDRYHFLPIVLDVIPELTAIFSLIMISFQWLSQDQQHSIGAFIDHYHHYVDIPRWLVLSIYLWKTFGLRHHHTVKNSTPTFTWLKQLVLGFGIFQLLWLLFLVPYSIPSLEEKVLNLAGWYPVYIPLMLLVYWLSIRGYLMRHRENPKITKTKSLNQAIIEQTIRALAKAMEEEKLYLDAQLNLAQTVKHIGSSQKVVSAVLNQHLGKSFNEYVNGFRVEEVKLRLIDEQYQHYTITGIALASGFNSQATFQRAFKAITKQSPSVYRKENLQKSSSKTGQA